MSIVNVFYCYSKEDEKYKSQLEKHLAVLIRTNKISTLHNKLVTPGSVYDEEINHYIKSAHIILILVSSDFMASDYCYNIEMLYALNQQKSGKSIVIPIVLRAVDWQDSPIGHLTSLPSNFIPISNWANMDEAFLDVVYHIKKVIIDLHSNSLKIIENKKQKKALIVTSDSMTKYAVNQSYERFSHLREINIVWDIEYFEEKSHPQLLSHFDLIIFSFHYAISDAIKKLLISLNKTPESLNKTFFFRRTQPISPIDMSALEGALQLHGIFSNIPRDRTYLYTQKEEIESIIFKLFMSEIGNYEYHKEAISSYLNRLINRTRWVDLLGVTNHMSDIKVELQRVYAKLLVQPSTSNISEMASESLTIDQAIKKYPFLVVTGKPGSGKTTFLRYLINQISNKALNRLSENLLYPFPVLVSLKELAACLPTDNLTDFPETLGDILEVWSNRNYFRLPHNFLRTLLYERKLALLLDGFDEIPDKRSRARISNILYLASDVLNSIQNNGYIIITTRPVAYTKEVALPFPFALGRLLDLEDNEMNFFIDSWIKALYTRNSNSNEISNKESTEIKKVITLLPQLKELSRNPMMLTVLALVYHEYKKIPLTRVKLYNEALTVLLKRFNFGYSKWDSEFTKKVLAHIALEFMRKSDSNLLCEESKLSNISEHISYMFNGSLEQAKLFILFQEEQAGILLCPDGYTLRFMHRTFQEYLAAECINSLNISDIKFYYKTHLLEPSWRETLKFSAAILVETGALSNVIVELLDYDMSIVESAEHISSLVSVIEEAEMISSDNSSIFSLIKDKSMELISILADKSVEESIRIGVAEAISKVGDIRLVETDQWSMVPCGLYWRGAADEDSLAYTEESPSGWINLSAFFMQKWQVTVSQYKVFIEDGSGYELEKWWSTEGWKWRIEDDIISPALWEEQKKSFSHPVVGISYYEAEAFCNWYTSIRLYNKDGYVARLPTEAEWEKSARGGKKISSQINSNPQRIYPWGNMWDASNVNADWRLGHTTPVGCFCGGHSPYEIWDLSGNVWEWCFDWFDPHAYDLLKGSDPCNKKENKYKVCKGGGWTLGQRALRTSFRFKREPYWRDAFLGFRVVLSKIEF